MPIDFTEWDDDNVEHATRHGVSVDEINQAIANCATTGVTRRNKRGRSADIWIESATDGGASSSSAATTRRVAPSDRSPHGRTDEQASRGDD